MAKSSRDSISISSEEIESNFRSRNNVEYDPFKERTVENPLTKFEALMNLLKTIVSSGVNSVPFAFKYTGLITGACAIIFTSFICTYCAKVLVRCAHVLCKKHRRPSLSYSEVVELACAKGPQWARSMAVPMKNLIAGALALTFFGTCSLYIVIAAGNFEQIVRHYFGVNADVRIYIACLVVPFILIAWIPDLKYLVPFAFLANLFIFTGLFITMYYCLVDMPPLQERPLHVSVMGLPTFFSIVMFSMESIGIVLPLENEMENPRELTSGCGVLNISAVVVTIAYGLIGFLGYAKFGDEIKGSITLNLPTNEISAQIAKIFSSLALFIAAGLIFYLFHGIVWAAIQDRFTKRPTFFTYVSKTFFMCLAVLVAVLAPSIGPFVGLLGALCFSTLGLLVPIFVETVVYWQEGFGRFYWIFWKNLMIIALGLIALVLGTQSAIQDIVELYSQKEIHEVTWKDI